MKNKGCAKFWGANKVHYGRCASGEFGKAGRLLPSHPPSPPLPPTLVLYAITVQTGIVKVYFSKKCMRFKIFVQIRTGANTQVCQRCMTRLDSREKCCRFTMNLSHLGKCQNLVCLLQQSYRIMKCSIHLPKKGLVTLKIPGKILKMQC